jgi:hypothetical protein
MQSAVILSFESRVQKRAGPVRSDMARGSNLSGIRSRDGSGFYG